MTVKKMDYGSGFKNGVLIFALIIAVHVILTKPEAIQNLLLTTAFTVSNDQPIVKDTDSVYNDTDLLKFVYSDEDDGALERFFQSKVNDDRFEDHDILPEYHIKDESTLTPPVQQPEYVLGIDTFASTFACPV